MVGKRPSLCFFVDPSTVLLPPSFTLSSFLEQTARFFPLESWRVGGNGDTRCEVLLQQGVRLIVRLNRRKSRKGTPTALVPAPFAPRRDDRRKVNKEKETRKREIDRREKRAARRFQSDTNLYGREILAILRSSTLLFLLVVAVVPSLGLLLSVCLAEFANSLFRWLHGINWYARIWRRSNSCLACLSLCSMFALC